jgi:hypothetical protein
MTAYIWYTTTADVDAPISVIGDSYYYLGFILTLVSLTISLISLTDENVSISNIIGSFGAAMLTTIVGLIARLVTTTFSIESAQRREQLDKGIERELDKFLSQLRTMTDKVTEDFITISTNITSNAQIANDSFKEVGSTLSKATKSFSNKIEESVDGLVERINSIKVDPLIVENTVKNSLSDFSEGILVLKKSYAEAVESVKVVNDKLVSQYDNLQSELINTHDNLAKQLSQSIDKSLGSLRDSLIEVKKEINGNRDSLSLILKESNNTISKVVDSYVHKVNEMKDVTTSIIGNVKDVEIVAISAGKIMNEHHKVLNQEALAFNEKKRALDELLELNEQLSNTLQENKVQIKKFETLLSETVPRLDQSLTNLDVATSSIKTVNQLAVDDLADTYKRLSVAIKKLEVTER